MTTDWSDRPEGHDSAARTGVNLSEMAPLVDVVVVSFNSCEHLRGCVEPLVGIDDVRVTIVDNASSDGSLEAVADLPVTTISLERNGGFASGSNAGWRAGEGAYVLLLNPDARIDQESLYELVQALERDPAAGAAAPKILAASGELHYSQRRFPRLRSTYGQALFLHRIFPRATWADELVRREENYERAGSPEWVSGACMLVRRSALEELGGLDEGFFLYCEDTDLCRRLRNAGHDVRFEPEALALHEGGASSPRSGLLPVLAASRIRYARKHYGRLRVLLERIGIGLGAVTHLVAGRGGAAARSGHARALRAVLSGSPDAAP
jgi:N-acetylglucosaminyl-diphospho-decaprenol L-rhamnosyltransferase